MHVSLTNHGWLIKGEFWDSDFAHAIAPVEVQRLLAKRLHIRATQVDKGIGSHMITQAKKMEASAGADASCEVKWGARDKE